MLLWAECATMGQVHPGRKKRRKGVEPLTVDRRKLQRLQRMLLGAVAVATVLGELVYIFLRRATIVEAALDGLLTMAIATVLVQVCFRIVYRLLPTE